MDEFKNKSEVYVNFNDSDADKRRKNKKITLDSVIYSYQKFKETVLSILVTLYHSITYRVTSKYRRCRIFNNVLSYAMLLIYK